MDVTEQIRHNANVKGIEINFIKFVDNDIFVSCPEPEKMISLLKADPKEFAHSPPTNLQSGYFSHKTVDGRIFVTASERVKKN